jgi:hypothetical protein
MKDRRPDVMFHAMLGGACLVVTAAAFVMQVDNGVGVRFPGIGRLPETCWFHKYTGYACPGCGLTRSFISLAHGELAKAWWFNPAGPLFFVLVAAQVPYRAWQVWRVRAGRSEVSLGRWEWLPAWTIAGLLFGQWLLRFAVGF